MTYFRDLYSVKHILHIKKERIGTADSNVNCIFTNTKAKIIDSSTAEKTFPAIMYC